MTAVEPADGPEEKTDDAQAEEKPKPGKTGRRGKAGADDEAWLAWIDELTAKGENPTASKAVDAGLAASGSTAKGISPASEESIRKGSKPWNTTA